MSQKSLNLNKSMSLVSTEVIQMSFKKVTISVPENLYKESMLLVKKGFFSNFSDLVRSGIREEFKNLKEVVDNFDERSLYQDKELIKSVKKSQNQLKEGKVISLKNKKEVDEFFRRI
jgi:Arc/MetJ-type ribon-helix-helix transcriptional regulator